MAVLRGVGLDSIAANAGEGEVGLADERYCKYEKRNQDGVVEGRLGKEVLSKWEGKLDLQQYNRFAEEIRLLL